MLETSDPLDVLFSILFLTVIQCIMTSTTIRLMTISVIMSAKYKQLNCQQ